MSSADKKEQLYCKKARGEEPLSLDEISELSAVDPAEVKRQVARVGRVIKHQALAGTAAEREAARQTLAHATARLKTEAPDIAGEIGKLQAKQRELEGAVKSAEGVVTRHENACRVLRENAPPHVVTYVSNARRLLNEQYRARHSDADRVTLLRTVLAIDTATLEGRAQAIAHADGYGHRECLRHEKTGNGSTTVHLDEKKWQQYVSELRAELPGAEDQLAHLEATYRAELGKLEKSLDVYIPQ